MPEVSFEREDSDVLLQGSGEMMYNFPQIFGQGVNLILALIYVLGALVTLFPTQQSLIPHEMGYTALGVLLFMVAIFGYPYFIERDFLSLVMGDKR